MTLSVIFSPSPESHLKGSHCSLGCQVKSIFTHRRKKLNLSTFVNSRRVTVVHLNTIIVMMNHPEVLMLDLVEFIYIGTIIVFYSVYVASVTCYEVHSDIIDLIKYSEQQFCCQCQKQISQHTQQKGVWVNKNTHCQVGEMVNHTVFNQFLLVPTPFFHYIKLSQKGQQQQQKTSQYPWTTALDKCYFIYLFRFGLKCIGNEKKKER